MADTFRFAIVDDSETSAVFARSILESAGHEVVVFTSPAEALRVIPTDPPHCVLLDILMPEIDGLEVCSRLKAMDELKDLKVVMYTSKSFDFDRRRATEMGADGYIVKPVDKDTLLTTLERVLAGQIQLTFWGIRGTLPRPGPDTVRYGGNTCCVSLEFPRDQLFVFDAGSGIKMLGDHLIARGERLTGKVFISHPHWDHINTLPFFTPLYITGNEFEILGSPHGPTKMVDLVNAQMDGVFFPITSREFGAKIEYRDLREGSYEFGEIRVDTMLLSHPGNCLGYRVAYAGRSICYITDNELFPKDSAYYSAEYEEHLTNFVRGCDALIIDTNYFDDEYEARVGWGHSSVTEVATLARNAEVKTLYPFHHDHKHNDDDIDRKIEQAHELLEGSSTRCVQPVEGVPLAL